MIRTCGEVGRGRRQSVVGAVMGTWKPDAFGLPDDLDGIRRGQAEDRQHGVFSASLRWDEAGRYEAGRGRARMPSRTILHASASPCPSSVWTEEPSEISILPVCGGSQTDSDALPDTAARMASRC